MEDYLTGIGKRIKESRKLGTQTISEIASKAGVSGGLISRIENGRTIPSLPVLLKIISALEISVVDFFNGMPKANGHNYIISRKADRTVIEKEDGAEGFTYFHIFGKHLNTVGFEAILLEILPISKRDLSTTDAFEFKFILTGTCHYVIGQEEVQLREGDSIFFDGRIPHVPVNREAVRCKMLVLYFYI